ncbi:MAG TPA: universal stress protein [Kofleriaceae bacterium]|nr:universal stress protein [Kofleriaceae bacterium]
MPAIERILVPTDFSPHSAEATAWAAELAGRFGASITLVHVFQPVSMILPEGFVLKSADEIASLMSSLDAALVQARNQLASLAPRVSIDSVLLEGAPFAEIVRHARENGFDLIVLGTHGRSGLRHALLGSVAEKVVRKAPCPVLTVRLAGHDFEHP